VPVCVETAFKQFSLLSRCITVVYYWYRNCWSSVVVSLTSDLKWKLGRKYLFSWPLFGSISYIYRIINISTVLQFLVYTMCVWCILKIRGILLTLF